MDHGNISRFDVDWLFTLLPERKHPTNPYGTSMLASHSGTKHTVIRLRGVLACLVSGLLRSDNVHIMLLKLILDKLLLPMERSIGAAVIGQIQRSHINCGNSQCGHNEGFMHSVRHAVHSVG